MVVKDLDFKDGVVAEIVSKYLSEYRPVKIFNFMRLVYKYHCGMDKLVFDEVCGKILASKLNFMDTINSLNIKYNT